MNHTILTEIRDLIIQNILNKNEDKRKVKCGSQCSEADFDAFDIIGLEFSSQRWKDCENNELLRFVKSQVEIFFQTIAAKRKVEAPVSKGAVVHAGNKSTAKVSGSFQLQQSRPQSTSFIPKAVPSTQNFTRTTVKSSQRPTESPSSAIFWPFVFEK